MPNTEIGSVMALAERISNNIKAAPFRDIQVRISIGVTAYKETDTTIDEIIKRADERLYEAKAAGRDCVRGCKV